jgi:hypothetical protein
MDALRGCADIGARTGARLAALAARRSVRDTATLPANPTMSAAMEPTFHPFSELFLQLGLPNDEASIQGFIRQHSPLPADVRLPDAPFWSPAQATFLKEQFLEDAEWAEQVDQLNLALHKA